MPRPPHDAESMQGYLVATPPSRRRGRPRRAWIAAALVAVALVTGGVAAAAIGMPPAASGPSLTAAPDPEVSTSAAPAPAGGATSLTEAAAGGALLLELPTNVAATGIAVFFPGQGADAAAALQTAAALALKDAGWALAAAESAPSGWASPTSTADIAELLGWAADYAPSSPMIVVAEGTGAGTSIAALGRDASFVPACWIATVPVTDVMAQAQADSDVRDEILEAWGRVPDEAELPRAFVDGLPAETGYRVIPPAAAAPALVAEDTATLVAALESSGHDVRVVAADGTDPRALLELAEGCAA